MRLILATIALLCLQAFADDPPPVPSAPGLPATSSPPVDTAAADNKAQILALIQDEVGRAKGRAIRAKRCCSGNQYSCNESKELARAIYKTNSQTQADVSGLGASGAAVAKGQLTDNASAAGDALGEACRQTANRCYETANSQIEDFKTRCPDCDLQALATERDSCPTKGQPEGKPQNRQLVVTKPNEPPTPIVPGPPVSGGYPASQIPGDSRPTISPNPTVTAPTHEHPVEVTGDRENKEYRKSLGDGSDKPWLHDKDKDRDQLADKDLDNLDRKNRGDGMTPFSESLAKVGQAPGSGFQTASVGGGNSAGGAQPSSANSGSSAPVAPVGAYPSFGSVGMRESAPRNRAGRAIAAQPSTFQQAIQGKPALANNPAAMQMGYAGYQPAAGGGPQHVNAPANAGGSGPGTIAGNSAGRNQFSQPNIATQSMGGGAMGNASTQSAAQTTKTLASYLPKVGTQAESYVGGSAPAHQQILSQGKDVWQNMSMRLQYFCKIGRLYDCK